MPSPPTTGSDFFAKYPDWAALYADRVLLVALCQGAALHYLSGDVGINDFDVYTFYAAHPDRRWYDRRRAVRDFGDPKFGVSGNRPRFVGRRVDLLGRGIAGEPGGDPVAAVRAYLRGGRTETAEFLAAEGGGGAGAGGDAGGGDLAPTLEAGGDSPPGPPANPQPYPIDIDGDANRIRFSRTVDSIFHLRGKDHNGELQHRKPECSSTLTLIPTSWVGQWPKQNQSNNAVAERLVPVRNRIHRRGDNLSHHSTNHLSNDGR